MGSFESKGYRFALDRQGTEITDADRIEIDVDYDLLGMTSEAGPTEMGTRLSALFGETVEDEEGIFDLVVSVEDDVVAAIVIACEEDAIALGGERRTTVTDHELADALIDALRARP